MLFVGDIHICKKQQHALLEQLRGYFAQHADEKQIIFLGDYVYHFTYERGALLALFGLFVELLQQGKELWILSGNHDRLQGHFVFDEARQLCDLMGNEGKRLHIITQPQFATIEDQEVLFMPSLPFDQPVAQGEKYAYLEAEEHPNAKQSARLNQCMTDMVQEWRAKGTPHPLLLIHHRYVINTVFPGQQARFSFTSPGIDAEWLDATDIRMLSGHLHSAFVHKNYLCTGSIWYTSPLESNEVKWMFRRETGDNIFATPFVINPYIVIDQKEGEMVDQAQLQELRQILCQKSASLLQSTVRDVVVGDTMPALPLTQTTLTIRRPIVDYTALDSLVDMDTQRLLADVKIKATLALPSVLLEEINDASLELTERISDRKILLRRYIDAKYTDRAPAYRSLLQEMSLV